MYPGLSENFVLALYISNDDSNLLQKVLILLKKVGPIKKLSISKVEGYLKSNIRPKLNIQNNA